MMDFEELTQEQKDRLRACKTPEEILELAKEEGYELSDDELEAVSGGNAWDDFDKWTRRNLCGGNCTIND